MYLFFCNSIMTTAMEDYQMEKKGKKKPNKQTIEPQGREERK